MYTETHLNYIYASRALHLNTQLTNGGSWTNFILEDHHITEKIVNAIIFGTKVNNFFGTAILVFFFWHIDRMPWLPDVCDLLTSSGSGYLIVRLSYKWYENSLHFNWSLWQLRGGTRFNCKLCRQYGTHLLALSHQGFKVSNEPQTSVLLPDMQ